MLEGVGPIALAMRLVLSDEGFFLLGLYGRLAHGMACLAHVLC